MANEIVETKAIEHVSDSLYKGVSDIIDNARQEVVVYVNKHSDLMFWHIGHYINEDMGYKQYSAYGSKILATLSQRLTSRYGNTHFSGWCPKRDSAICFAHLFVTLHPIMSHKWLLAHHRVFFDAVF